MDTGRRRRNSLRRSERGALAWFARNSVAANVLMAIIMVGGLVVATQVQQEVFPEIELDMVVVSVPYPGASPAEVEQGVILAIEEEVRGIDGVKAVRATATEGLAVVQVELLRGENPDQSLADVKSAVDRIASFPEDIERPTTYLATTRRRVLSLFIHGDTDEETLRAYAEQVRQRLLEDERVTLVELSGVRPREISVEVPREELRRYGLTLERVAQRIRESALELPAGEVETRRGDVLVRTTERKDFGREFADVEVLTLPDGARLRVGDIATVTDAFEDTKQEAFFEGERAVVVDVFRVGEQTPISVSEAAEEVVAELRPTLPPGISLSPWLDSSEVYEDRLKLLLKNAALGLGLVLLVLGAFLEPRLAFWVMLGIPLSFLGAMLLLPLLDVSINMVSLFAFIIVLGMVVDDAIVVGEAIYHRRQHGEPRLQAAIAGVREVSMPVVFAIVTTVLAFAPMLFVPGVGGKIFRNIPLIVIPVLLFSLVEALLILPAHLAHSKPTAPRGVLGWVVRRQEKVARGLEWFTSHVYARHLRAASRRRYLTLAVFVSILVATLGLVAGGRVGFVFMPRVESDMVSVRVELPFGAPVEDTRAAKERVEHAAREALAALGGEHYARGQFSQLGAATLSPGGGPDSGAGAHVAEVAVHLVPADARPFGAEAFSRQWREEIGELPGVERLSFDFATASSGEAPIAFDLRHPDPEQLEAAGARLAQRLSTYTGVFDVDDGFTEGKEQLDLTLTAEGRSLGLTAADVARQVRSAFFGAEALRQQRGRDEVRVYVRLPRSQQRSEQDVEDFLLRTPQGGEVPLRVAADVERGRSYAEILRRDGFRIAPVTADVDPAVTNANEVVARVIQQDLPALQEEFPGLTWRLGGEQREQREALGSLGRLFLLAMLAIYALLATALRSYVQPLIILSAVPFGLVGAVLGHVLMGYDLSLMSMMGVVALSGVVVNDSLLLVVTLNALRAEEGMKAEDAVVQAGTRRFRPILLTTLTTFFGLAPLILETSVQARFLIPMALSLGFGILFATAITLLLVPSLYLMTEDAKRLKVPERRPPPSPPPPEPPARAPPSPPGPAPLARPRRSDRDSAPAPE